MKVALGGDRLGSGKKRDLELHNYYRSTHNLSQDWASSMAPGVLYPFLVIPTMRGDKFHIDLEAAARTIPTQGPLFGSFKMQTDVFFCPLRLYQGILHNNPLAIGLKMNQVKLPTISLACQVNNTRYRNLDWYRMHPSSLAKYLGISGMGVREAAPTGTATQKRKFNAVPFLAYYDIFKNYYANKQEEKAYVITMNEELIQGTATIASQFWHNSNNGMSLQPKISDTDIIYYDTLGATNLRVSIKGSNLTPSGIHITGYGFDDSDSLSIQDILNRGMGQIWKNTTDEIILELNMYQFVEYIGFTIKGIIAVPNNESENVTRQSFILKEFNLSDIDKMRYELLSQTTLGVNYDIYDAVAQGNMNNTVYQWLTKVDLNGKPYMSYPHNGLVVKTYQSDIFNNWVDTEWIDGENGIAALAAVTTTGGSFTIDSLNLAEKLYNMLNRVAVSGGTYEEWQDTVYEDVKQKRIESPIYCGGMSSEIVFEEIVQSAPAEGEPLGTLGGRGTLLKRKGGNITIKCDEAGFIIGMVSLTPRIYYTQGNEFYMTDIFTMDDLHKPALDGIGFQDLIMERFAWWDTRLNSAGGILGRHSAGKIPAWSEYMTSVNKAYGDFALESGKGFMILGRNYEADPNNLSVVDVTTYIDPRKYNYAFAYTELDAQNFWVQIRSNITARRLMSAKQIPNI